MNQDNTPQGLELIKDQLIKQIAASNFANYTEKRKMIDSLEIINKVIDENKNLLNKSFSPQKLLPMSDKLDEIVSNLLTEKNIVIPTFSQDLNYLLNGGLKKGRLYFLDAPFTSGKSTLANQIGDLSSLNGFKICYASYDLSSEQIFTTSISRLSQINHLLIEAKEYLHNPEVKINFFQAIAKYKEEMAGNIHLVEADDLYPPNRLLEICQELKIELLIVDYLQLLITENQNLDNAYQETFKLSTIVTQLKRIARQLNIAVIVISNNHKQNYQSLQDKFGLKITILNNILKIARSSDVIMFLMSNNFTDSEGNNHSQLDMIANKFLGIDILLNRKIKNLAHSFPLDKNTNDTYSRLIITKNNAGKCGEILLRYKKDIYTFEAINYLTRAC